MKVLMLGWEYPPYNTGGLGTACYGLTQGLTRNNAQVTLVLPYGELGPNIRGTSTLSPDRARYYGAYARPGRPGPYGHTIFADVCHYTQAAVNIAQKESFDIIHANDWLTLNAGRETKKKTGKPLIAHIHATEFDRAGHHINPEVYKIERKGLRAADKIITVSNYTKKKIIMQYGIDPNKIEVVHNAVERISVKQKKHLKDKIVLFLGRITMQKGPDYFLAAANKVLQHDPDVLFIMAGTGDMEGKIIERAAELGIADRFLFTGFLQGTDVARMFQMADVYVMPSISEPFGITALEAIAAGTPCIVSRNAGVREVTRNCLTIDFWDIEDIANKILSVLAYPQLASSLKKNAKREIAKLSWKKQAQECITIYQEVIAEAEW